MRGKIGAEWTIAKLMSIVLAVVILAIVVWGIGPQGMIPLKERVGDMMDNVIGLFGFGRGSGVSECYKDYTAPAIQGVDNNFMFEKCKDNCSVFLSEPIIWGGGASGQNFSYVRTGRNKYEFKVIDGGNARVLSPHEFLIDSEVVKEREIYHAIRGAIYGGLEMDGGASDSPDYSKDLNEDVKELFVNWSSNLYIMVGDDRIYKRVIFETIENSLEELSEEDNPFELKGGDIYFQGKKTNFYLSEDIRGGMRVISYRRSLFWSDWLMGDVPEIGFVFNNSVTFYESKSHYINRAEDKIIKEKILIHEREFLGLVWNNNHLWGVGNFNDGFKNFNWNDELANYNLQKALSRRDSVYYRIGEGHSLDRAGEWRILKTSNPRGNLVYFINNGDLKENEFELFFGSSNEIKHHYIGIEGSTISPKVAEIDSKTGVIKTTLKISSSVDNREGIRKIGPLVKDYVFDLAGVRFIRGYEKFDGDNLDAFIREKINESEKVEGEKQRTLNDLNQRFDGLTVNVGGQAYDLKIATDFERPLFYVEIEGNKSGISHDGVNLVLTEFNDGSWTYSKNMNKIQLSDSQFQDFQKLNFIHRYLVQRCFGVAS